MWYPRLDQSDNVRCVFYVGLSNGVISNQPFTLDTLGHLFHTVDDMDSGDTINELEQHILNSLMLLGLNAYGMTVHEKVEELRDGRSVSLGTIYTTLDELERRGYVRSWFSDPTPERGGRVKRYFEITGSGEMTLRNARRVPAMGSVWKEIGGAA